MPQLQIGDFPPQIIWLLISFSLLYLALSFVVLPRIAHVLDERRQRIEGDLARASMLRTEMDAAISGYESALADARNRAKATAQAARDRIDAEIKAQSHAVEEELAIKSADAEQRIGAVRDAAMAQVDSIAAETAGAIVERMTGRQVDGSAAAAAVASVHGGAGNG